MGKANASAITMSGPTTVIFTADAGIALLAAAAIRAAQAVQEAQLNADALHDKNLAARQQNRSAQQQAIAAGRAALAERQSSAVDRHTRLRALCDGLGLTTAPAPAEPDDDPVRIEAHLQTLALACSELERILHAHAEAMRAEQGEDAVGLATDLLAALSPPAAGPRTKVDTNDRPLERLARLGPLAPEIEQLRQEIAAAPNEERAELLTMELRRRVQLALQAAQEQAVLQANAIILEQSLKDLGYQVDSVAETLFVDGGIVHFSRPGWQDYQVRLRVDAKGSANFNVVRAVDKGNNERSVLDHLAEDRWCAEFPALLRALEMRGLRLTVTRRLAAGELPVQLVAREQLPDFSSDEIAEPLPGLKQKEL